MKINEITRMPTNINEVILTEVLLTEDISSEKFLPHPPGDEVGRFRVGVVDKASGRVRTQYENDDEASYRDVYKKAFMKFKKPGEVVVNLGSRNEIYKGGIPGGSLDDRHRDFVDYEGPDRRVRDLGRDGRSSPEKKFS